MKQNIFDKSLAEWEEYVALKNLPLYRAKQIFTWLHRDNVFSSQEMSNLPLNLREMLSEEFFWPKIQELSKQNATDGTVKFLFSFEKNKIVETVWLPYPNRQSLCVSVQSGCSLNCSFCATGKIPFRGNLQAGEILTQLYLTQAIMKKKVTNVVFMGMGEPFYNYDATLKAAKIMHSVFGQSIGARHITISTAGVLPGIKRFLEEKEPFGLALSLHAVFPEKRAEIMDIEKKYPLKEILAYLKSHRHLLRKNRFTFEYIMIPNFNLYEEDAKELARLAKDLGAKINLIPLNTEFIAKRPPTEEEANAFFQKLCRHGVIVRNRRSPGKEIQAACGMLAAQMI